MSAAPDLSGLVSAVVDFAETMPAIDPPARAGLLQALASVYEEELTKLGTVEAARTATQDRMSKLVRANWRPRINQGDEP